MDDKLNILRTKFTRYKLVTWVGLVVVLALVMLASLVVWGNRAQATERVDKGNFEITKIEAKTLKDGIFNVTIESDQSGSKAAFIAEKVSDFSYYVTDESSEASAYNDCEKQVHSDSKGDNLGWKPGLLSEDSTVESGKAVPNDASGYLEKIKDVEYATDKKVGNYLANSKTLLINVTPNDHGKYVCIQVPGIILTKTSFFEVKDDDWSFVQGDFEVDGSPKTPSKYAFNQVAGATPSSLEEKNAYGYVDKSDYVEVSANKYKLPELAKQVSGNAAIRWTHTLVVAKLDIVKDDLSVTTKIEDLNEDNTKDDLSIKVSPVEYIRTTELKYAFIGKDEACNRLDHPEDDNAKDKFLDLKKIDATDEQEAVFEAEFLKYQEIVVDRNKAVCFRITAAQYGTERYSWVTSAFGTSDYVYFKYPVPVVVVPPVVPPVIPLSDTTEAQLTLTNNDTVVTAESNHATLVDIATIQYVTMPIRDTMCLPADFTSATTSAGHYGGTDGSSIKSYSATNKPAYRNDIDYCFRAKVTATATNGDKDGYIYAHLNQTVTGTTPGTGTPPPTDPVDGGTDPVDGGTDPVDGTDGSQPVVNQPPSINHSQATDSNVVEFSASDSDGVDATSWQAVGPLDADPGVCNETNFVDASTTLTAETGNLAITLSDADNSKFYCARVADNQGETGYIKVSVDENGRVQATPTTDSGTDGDGTTGDGTDDGATGDEEGGSKLPIIIVVIAVVVVGGIIVFVVMKNRADN